MSVRLRTVYRGEEALIIEKRSKFIAAASHAGDEEEALAFIESVRKRHRGADHNCFAYSVGGEKALERSGDDGEPGGTAGRPILDAILGERLHDTVIAVTRYFGGILLGAGNLARTYRRCAAEGIKSSEIVTEVYGNRLCVETGYGYVGKIRNLLAKMSIPVISVDYSDKARVTAAVPEEAIGAVTAKIAEGTGGVARVNVGEECRFADAGGELIIF